MQEKTSTMKASTKSHLANRPLTNSSSTKNLNYKHIHKENLD